MTAEIYHGLIYGWIALAVVMFVVLLKIKAPYGRHASRRWGPVIANRWGWIIMEAPVLIVFWLCISFFGRQLPTVTWFIVGLFSLHYFHRALIYPFRVRTKGKAMPLLIAGSGVVFNLMNGFVLGYYLACLSDYPEAWFSDPRLIIGVVIFFSGMVINLWADTTLIGLRRPGETDYVIPRGWLFRKISCPNHLGEMIEWLGFAILTWSLPACAFFIWTVANLGPRALAHHKWYQEKFPDYPKTRKALIPFLI